MTKLYVDIETFSSVDLPKTNVYRYTESPDFRILMAAWCWEDEAEPWVVEDPDENRTMFLDAWNSKDVTFVAHNAAFERICFSRHAGLPTGTYYHPQRFHDTQAIAAEYGYPKKLGRLAEWLGGEQKDEAGTRLINLFSVPNRAGKRNTSESHPEEWELFRKYCAQDVVTLMSVDNELGDFPTETERRISFTDQEINDRGLAIDTDLARAAVAAAKDNRMVQELRVMHLTGVKNPGSQPQFLRWCKEEISPRITNLQKETVTKILASPNLSPVHKEVLELRQELALVASKKFDAALASVSEDGRLRGTLNFFGAHTGRWSGKGAQPQNLPREAFKTSEETEAAIVDLLLTGEASSLDLKRLVRALFLINGSVLDYSSIEARVIAWLAGEQWALDAFAAGRDIYVETAERMSTKGQKLTRAQGKVAVLALGYAGGVGSLQNMGAEGSPDDLQRLVNQWRRANPRICTLWGELESAVSESDGDLISVGDHIKVIKNDEHLRIYLPSGRSLNYHGIRWERYVVFDPKKKKSMRKEGWQYDDPRKPGMRIGTYGGRLSENITQAVARDILAESLVRLSDAGYRPVTHIHDEIAVEGSPDRSAIRRLMCTLPAWATGLPLDAEGFTTERYRKG